MTQALSLAPSEQRTPDNVRWCVRCKAHNRQGGRCGLWALRGAYVCKLHGGGAPQTKRMAQRRIEAVAFTAIDRLEALLDHKDPHAQLAAAKMILDYAGIRPSRQHQGVDGQYSEVDAFIEAITV